MAQDLVSREKQGSGMTRRMHQPLDLFRREFDRLFDRFFAGWLTPFGQEFGEMRVWNFDVTQNDEEVLVRAELPGFDENELNVQLSGNILTIQAEKEQKGDGQEEYRNFYRSVTLPAGVDAEKVKATYRNGVLELHIPRAEEAKPKRISVHGQQAETPQASVQQAPAAEGRRTAAQADVGKKPQMAKA